jgi:hypothetical protein
MTEPVSKWHFDLQTLILLGGIGATLVAWGYTLSGIQSAVHNNTVVAAQLTVRLEQNDSKTNLLDVRVAALEKIAADAIMLRRELETTIGQFKSDIAVMKEILERLDKENGRAVQP